MAVEYIQAVASFLKSLPSVEADVQQQQAELILQKISVKTPAEAAAIVLALKELPVQDAILSRLISRTTALALESQHSQDLVGRRALQDYTNIWKYMTQSKCFSFQQSSDKLDWLRRNSEILGLTNPTEKTFQMLTALLLTVEKSSQDLSPAVKLESLKALKGAFVRTKQASPTTKGFLVLPDPSDLVQRHPDIAACFFGDDGWSATALDQLQILRLADSIPMRVTRRDSKVQVLLESKPDTSAMAFAQQLSQQLQQMQYMQAYTLSALQGNPNVVGCAPSGLNPHSSPATLGRHFIAAPTLPSLPAPPTAPPSTGLAIADGRIDTGKEAKEVPENDDDKAETPPGKRLSLGDVTRQLQSGMAQHKEAKKANVSAKKKAETSSLSKPSKVEKGKVASNPKSSGKKISTSRAPKTKPVGKATYSCTLSKSQRLKLRPNPVHPILLI
jgi:hypothetical protein